VNEEHPVGSAHAGFMPPLVNATPPFGWSRPTVLTGKSRPFTHGPFT